MTMSKLDDFVSAIAVRDAEAHAIDFAELLNDLDSNEKAIAIGTFLENITVSTNDVLENEMDIII
jgi:hypothetical protein